MNIQKFFSKIYYINLDHRSDRREMAEKEFAKLGIEPERFSAQTFSGNYSQVLSPAVKKQADGIIGCMLSHKSILISNKMQEKPILIFEDDVKFINDFLTIIPEALEQLSTVDWDMFYLGGNICNTITQISSRLGKLSHAQSTHAYAVNGKFINQLIDYIPTNQVIPLDLVYSSIIPKHNCFITIPMVAVQQKSFSDIEGREVEYETWMEGRFYQQLRRLES